MTHENTFANSVNDSGRGERKPGPDTLAGQTCTMNRTCAYGDSYTHANAGKEWVPGEYVHVIQYNYIVCTYGLWFIRH